MGHIWVEFWITATEESGSHAQKVFTEPDPHIISRRFFDSYETAHKFAKIVQNTGHVTRIKTDKSQ